MITQDAPLALRPPLRQHQPRLDRLAEADLVGQQHAPRERRPEREQRRVDLVRVQIDLGIDQGAGQPVVAVRRAAARQLVGQSLRETESRLMSLMKSEPSAPSAALAVY